MDTIVAGYDLSFTDNYRFYNSGSLYLEDKETARHLACDGEYRAIFASYVSIARWEGLRVVAIEYVQVSLVRCIGVPAIVRRFPPREPRPYQRVRAWRLSEF